MLVKCPKDTVMQYQFTTGSARQHFEVSFGVEGNQISDSVPKCCSEFQGGMEVGSGSDNQVCSIMRRIS